MSAKIDFDRLNHILIPATKEGRDRLRESALGRALAPLFYLYEALSTEGLVLAVAALVCGGMGLDVAETDTHVLWAALSALVLVSLLIARRYHLHGVALAVRFPPRVAAGSEMTFTLVLDNRGPAEHQAVRVFGPFLPWDGQWSGPRPAVPRLPAGERAEVQVRARFRQRGEHHLDPFRVAALAPLGLALGPSLHSGGSRFIVVPRIANVLRLRTPPGQRHQPGGVALAARTGEAMDLRGVRFYRPGDPVRDLHARSWARSGTPVVREYQQEYFSRIGVVLDTDTAGLDAAALEAAISLGGGVVGALSRGEALIDLLVVGGQVHQLTLGRSLGTFEQALDLLACVQAGPTLDVGGLLGQLGPHLPRLSCLLLICLRWDAARDTLCQAVRARGASCRALLVTEGAAGGEGVTPVSPAAIARGEALVL